MPPGSVLRPPLYSTNKLRSCCLRSFRKCLLIVIILLLVFLLCCITHREVIHQWINFYVIIEIFEDGSPDPILGGWNLDVDRGMRCDKNLNAYFMGFFFFHKNITGGYNRNKLPVSFHIYNFLKRGAINLTDLNRADCCTNCHKHFETVLDRMR